LNIPLCPNQMYQVPHNLKEQKRRPLCHAIACHLKGI